jgi:hypothetical protein
LVREGMAVNHKRVYRLYREEGLAMRIRPRRRIRWSGPASRPTALVKKVVFERFMLRSRSVIETGH